NLNALVNLSSVLTNSSSDLVDETSAFNFVNSSCNVLICCWSWRIRDSVEVWAEDGLYNKKPKIKIDKNTKALACVLNFIILKSCLILSCYNYNNTEFI
ncbi:MAG: hypothetical protein AAB958_00100, partial [Patescibacteria group bacterium]